MNLLLLPGNSKRNKEWIHSVEEVLKSSFNKTTVHHYNHWENDNDSVDFELEFTKLIQETVDYAPYSIFAKSLGSLLTLRGCAEGMITPHACMFAGLPLALITSEYIIAQEWLRNIKTPTLIIQNDTDPLGSYEEVSQFVSKLGNNNIKVVKLPGDTHSYDDMKKLTELSRFLIS